MNLRELKKAHNNLVVACNNAYSRTLLMGKISNISKNNVIMLQSNYSYYSGLYQKCVSTSEVLYRAKNNTLPKMLTGYYKHVYNIQSVATTMLTCINSIVSLLKQAYTLILMANAGGLTKLYVTAYLLTIVSQCNVYIRQIQSYNKNISTLIISASKIYSEVVN